MPPERAAGDGVAAAAFRDNFELPYEGIRATAISRPSSERCCCDLIEIVRRPDPRRPRRGEDGRGAAAPGRDLLRLDGRHDDEQRLLLPGPQPGHPDRVRPPARHRLDNDEPSRNHIHTVVRTPNGNDYGKDLLRQHYARFDHSQGRHTPR